MNILLVIILKKTTNSLNSISTMPILYTINIYHEANNKLRDFNKQVKQATTEYRQGMGDDMKKEEEYQMKILKEFFPKSDSLESGLEKSLNNK